MFLMFCLYRQTQVKLTKSCTGRCSKAPKASRGGGGLGKQTAGGGWLAKAEASRSSWRTKPCGLIAKQTSLKANCFCTF